MLILMRKKDGVIHIGDDIRIKVVKVVGGNVHLGIEAPRKLRILRHELIRRQEGEEDAR